MGTVTKCLFCDASLTNPIPFRDSSESLESKFIELCSILMIKLPARWKHNWNFGNEPFPFCYPCYEDVGRLCSLNDQVVRIQAEMKTIIVKVTAELLQSYPLEQVGFGRSAGSSHSTVDKYVFFRSTMIQRFNPYVRLGSDNRREVKSENVKTESANSRADPLKNIVDGSMDMKWFEPEEAADFDTDNDPDFDFEDVAAPEVELTTFDEDDAAASSKVPLNLSGSGGVSQDRIVRVIDPSKNIYGIGEYQFREVENGYECSTCNKITALKIVAPGAKNYPRYYYMRQHIIYVHVETRKVGRAAVWDKTTKTYEFEGFKFQEIGAQFQCLTCDTFCPNKGKANRLKPIKMHILRVHRKGGTPRQVTLIDESKKTYKYRECVVQAVAEGLQCSLCCAEYPLWPDIMKHIYADHPKPQQRCPACSFTYKEDRDLRRHIAMVHCGVSAQVVCELCGRIFKNQRYLNGHIQRVHTEGESFAHQCDQCGKYLSNAQILKEHIKVMHSGIRSHVCDQCGKTFARSSNLNNHMVTHTKEKRFKCGQCDKSFPFQRSLKLHVQAVHEGYQFPFKYSCEACGKAFRFSAALRKHYRGVHLGIRTVKKKKSQGTGSTSLDGILGI